jgi:hypothetical protein
LVFARRGHKHRKTNLKNRKTNLKNIKEKGEKKKTAKNGMTKLNISSQDRQFTAF